jgi:adenosylcobinamide-GDP ribazoletransferase
MSSFSLAWQFLTIVPWWKSSREVTPQRLGRSMVFYPAVGFFLGMLLWAAFELFLWIFPRTLVDGLIVAALVLVTGALHLDGLADTCDGLAAGRSPAERLQIMKDHRIGTFGAVALMMVLGIKFLALNSLPDEVVGSALLAALTLSRWSMVRLTYGAPYARPEGGLGQAFKEGLKKKQMVITTVVGLALAFWVYRFSGALLWLLVWLTTALMKKYCGRKFGGFTGDTLGALNEVNEVFVLLLISALEGLAET